jgi:hypothetical protein
MDQEFANENVLCLWYITINQSSDYNTVNYVVLAKSRHDAMGLATAKFLGEDKSTRIVSVTIENVDGRIVSV